MRARHPAATARDADAGSYLQTLLISAVVSVLLTRLYLQLTGFPRIGSGTFHVAHLLWGGLLMLGAQVLVLSVLGKRAKRVAAVLAGLGFGLFVDELGKFITSDNDYFFQPTIALIYVLFVGLFLVFRAIERNSLSPDELLVNAADMLREVVLGGATRAEVVRARRLLDRSGFDGPLADGLRDAIAGAVRTPEHNSRIVSAAARAWRTYDRLLDWQWFQRALLGLLVLQALGGLLTSVLVGWTMVHSQPLPLELGSLLSSLLSLGLVVVGVSRFTVSRLSAFRWFERSVLVSIFLTQVILFWQDQLAALSGLAWDLVVLAAVRFLIRQEEARTALRREPAAVPSRANL